jgi:hypothetical protein
MLVLALERETARAAVRAVGSIMLRLVPSVTFMREGGEDALEEALEDFS